MDAVDDEVVPRKVVAKAPADRGHMLHRFLTENRAELIKRTRAKVAARSAPTATEDELVNGVPLFLSQLADTLLREGTDEPFHQATIGNSAKLHGHELLRRGFTIGQVVHDYGDVCQAVTELALDQNTPITTAEFHTLNLCLDNAIAGAVTEWEYQRAERLSKQEIERLGILAHEQRNLLSSAMLAFQMLKRGTVAVGGSTGAVLFRALERLRNINNGTLADVRLSAGLHSPVRIMMAEFIEEEEVAAAMEATQRGLQLTVERPEYGLAVHADRMILGSALANLLQNAFKFTRAQGRVTLRVRSVEDRVLIEVEDECGGLSPGVDLFAAFDRGMASDTGLGLGLSIARRSVEASGGKLGVRDLPGQGCVFTIDLPAASPLVRTGDEPIH
jgi:signal transduction histidine kinase